MSAKRSESRLILRFINDIIAGGATVFGGAVRDVVLANQCESQYYASGGTERGFDDPSLLPEWADRLVVPEDIDAFIYDDDFAKMEHDWSRVNLQQVSREVVDVNNTYLNFPAAPGVVHYKYVLGIANREYFSGDLLLANLHPDLRALVADCVHRFAEDMTAKTVGCRRSIRMDLLVLPRGLTHKSVLTHHDFNVNGLCMDGRGVTLSPALGRGMTPLGLHLALQVVLKDVHAKRAQYIGWGDATNHRLLKLLAKGWTIPLALVKAVDGGYDGHCLICHERFDVGAAHFKLECCDARYHAPCLKDAAMVKMCDTQRCVMCSRSVNARALFVDVTILSPGKECESFPGQEPDE